MKAIIYVGRLPRALAPREVVEALFATISYRLELNGRGTRFPLILNELFAGRLEASHALDALSELSTIEGELRRLPPDRVVWSMIDLRRRDDRQQAVNHSAASVYEYFTGEDGKPLLAAIRETLTSSCESGEGIRLDSAEVRLHERQGWMFTLSGAAWIAIGLLLFPRAVWVLIDVDSVNRGFLLWPLGLLSLIPGIMLLLGRRLAARPARFWPSVIAAFAFIVAFLTLTYRSWTVSP